MCDEFDKYPITKEGNPLDLVDERMATFANWLSVRACSPTIAPAAGTAAVVSMLPPTQAPPTAWLRPSASTASGSRKIDGRAKMITMLAV